MEETLSDLEIGRVISHSRFNGEITKSQIAYLINHYLCSESGASMLIMTVRNFFFYAVSTMHFGVFWKVKKDVLTSIVCVQSIDMEYFFVFHANSFYLLCFHKRLIDISSLSLLPANCFHNKVYFRYLTVS